MDSVAAASAPARGALEGVELDGLPGSADEPVFVVFTAPWCEVCSSGAAARAELGPHVGDRGAVREVNVERSGHAAERLGVRSVPAVVLFARGREVARRIGAADASGLKAFADRALAEVPPKAAAAAPDGPPPAAGAPGGAQQVA